MSAELSLDGVAELRAALEAMPAQVRQTVGPVVRESADQMATELRQGYPKRDGVLAGRVVVEASRRGDPLFIKVRSKAPHAHLFEYGTVRRFTARSGAYRGTMPAQPIFAPAAVRWRAWMAQAAAARLRAWRVPGFAGSLDVRETP